MSTLKVNKIRDTSGSADAITLDPSGGAVLAGVTTISTARITTGITTSIQVGGGVTISESGIEASGIGITCANINGAQIGGRRNIIINGAMNIAQRGTSSSSSGNTQQTVDRFYVDVGGADEQPTQAQVDVASGTTPYTLGFRKSYKITNGNQTSGAGGTDYIAYIMKLEAQDIANSGWNYTDPNSFITLSFWIKSSVAQAFSGSLRSVDGSVYHYKYDTPSLSADTWTKVVKTIPGNANLTFDNNDAHGFTFSLQAFIGTTYTSSNSDTETWLPYSSTRFANNMTSTWYTTNDATLELTGVQLEVGSQATAFEHRSFADELALCQRYYWKQDSPYTSATIFTTGAGYGQSNTYGMIFFPVPMRTGGSGISMGYSDLSDFEWYENNTQGTPQSFLTSDRLSTYGGQLYYNRNGNGTSGYASWLRSANTNAYISWDCEL